jgi:hypothetical protein
LTGRTAALEIADPRRVVLAGLFALLLVLAQMLFAAHADDVADHAPQSCEYCLSASIAADPDDLIVEVSAPVKSFETVRSPVSAEIVVADALRAANPRGPPLL